MTPARRRFEYAVRFFVFYSISCYVIEQEIDTDNRSQGFWLWNERFCAAFFTLEYLIRWYNSDNPRRYPLKFLSVIDLIAILPFYIGFFVPQESLGVIRSLRVLRLFKLIRYSPALLLVIHSLQKVKRELLVLFYINLIVVLLSSSLIYHFEKAAQPDKFVKLSDAIW